MRSEPIVMLEQGGRGGVADYTGALVAALAAEGQPVELVTAADSLIPVPASGVREHRLVRYFRPTSAWRRAVRRARLGPVMNVLGYVSAVPGVVALGRRARLVHVQGGFPPLTLLLAVALRLAGVPMVHTPHNTFDRGRQFPRSRRWVGMLSARVIVHARADLPHLPPAVARRAVVIPHGEYGILAKAGGEADRGAARAELGIPDDATVALLFGQLRADKGVGDLLDAAAAVEGLHVVLAGEDLGALDENRALLDDPRLAGRLHVRAGFQPLDVAARLFAASDVAVLPYRVASQSGVLLLAYGFRRPVAVYPVGGLPEAVEEGETGWVAERSDPEALAAVLRAVIAAGPEECARRGAAGERLAEDRFSWRSIARLTEGVYDEVASKS
jgi:glycosyltransferase involved in cell wall biosynthesis